MRRNLLHNMVIHPLCGVIWLVADTAGLVGYRRLKDRLVAAGERLHADPRFGP